MTVEELREHCEKQVRMCEEWAKGNGREPSGKTYEEHKLVLDLIKSLEQQPSEDKVTITFNKGTLKHSDKGYVVYNKDWFRRHFATEVAIMTGYDGYIEQPTSDDCVSRKRIKQIVSNITAEYDTETIHIDRLMDEIDDMPSVTPTQNKCKDCKHWKDSDGVYRRGIDAKSKCHINIKEVYEGTFYCKDYEKRGDEE